ncbi:MAG: hypothetical protein R3264_10985, partial [Anaerolineae bacterium]|nr:hypothetical protein [Anaerolineae bacterium]
MKPNELISSLKLPSDLDRQTQAGEEITRLIPVDVADLPWQTTVSFTAYGLPFTLRTNVPAIMPRVNKSLPFGWKAEASPANGVGDGLLYSLWAEHSLARERGPAYHRLYVGNEQLTYSENLNAVLYRLENHCRLYVGQFSTERLFIHAGVVGYRGRAIVIPGRT